VYAVPIKYAACGGSSSTAAVPSFVAIAFVAIADASDERERER
jgi:hypothetical protein